MTEMILKFSNALLHKSEKLQIFNAYENNEAFVGGMCLDAERRLALIDTVWPCQKLSKDKLRRQFLCNKKRLTRVLQLKWLDLGNSLPPA